MTTINIHQLKTDRQELEDSIRAIKKELRSPWTRPMGALQWKLLTLKQRATELCILRAWARGRCHLSNAEHCQEVAERMALKYAMEEAA